MLRNSSNTSKRTSFDFQTPRKVEIARRSRAFLTNFEVREAGSEAVSHRVIA